AYRGGAQRAAGSQAAANWLLIGKTLLATERLGFLLLVGAGALLGPLLRPAPAAAFLAPPFAPPRPFPAYPGPARQQGGYFVARLALVAGFACDGLVRLGQRLRSRRDPLTGTGLALGMVTLGIYLASIPALGHAEELLLKDADERARRDYAGTQEQAA